MRRTACVAIGAALALAAAAPAGAATADRPSCRALLTRDYHMFSRAGDRAVGRVVESVAPHCRDRRLREREVFRRVRRGLWRVEERYDEVGDTQVLEEVADALEDADAVRRVDSLDQLF